MVSVGLHLQSVEINIESVEIHQKRRNTSGCFRMPLFTNILGGKEALIK